MNPAAIIALVGLIYQSDTIIKDSIHAGRIITHMVRHPKKSVTKPIATAKEAKAEKK